MRRYDEEDDHCQKKDSLSPEEKALEEIHRKMDLILKIQANRKKKADQAKRYNSRGYVNKEINYIENNQSFQNKGYSNQGYNNQPFRSNPDYQAEIPRRTFDYPNQTRSYKDDVTTRLGNLIRRATEEHTRLSEKTNYMLVSMTANIESRMSAWECRLENLEKRLTIAESQIADVTTAAEQIERENQNLKREDYCQLAEAPEKKEKEKGHVYYIRIVGDDDDANSENKIELPPYIPPLPFPSTVLIAERQKKDYDEASTALKVIESSPLFEEMMSANQDMKMHHEGLTACKKWFEERTGYYGLEKPYPTLKFSYNHFADLLASQEEMLASERRKVDPGGNKPINHIMNKHELPETKIVVKREDPGCFTLSCLINEEPIKDCVLDLGASKSIMPLHLGRRLLTEETDIEKVDTKIVLANWTTIRPVGLARDVPINVRGHIVPTDFLIIDTGDQRSKILLGRPFLSSVGAEINVRGKEITFNINEAQGKEKDNSTEYGLIIKVGDPDPPKDRELEPPWEPGI